MKHFWRTGLLAFAAVSFYAGAAMAQNEAGGDPAAGQAKANTCVGCHGVANYSNVYPTYHVPKLGGQSAAYLVTALQAYKNGERRHPTMQGQASSFSEQDMRDIAAYLSQSEGATEGRGARAPEAWVEQRAQTCAGCHGQKGASPIANYPIIAGQYRSYLVQALTAYRDGERQNAIMSGQVQGLTDAQIEALAGYYARKASPLHVPTFEP